MPLKLMVVGDYSNGAERVSVSINKNNFNCVMAQFSLQVNLAVENTLADDGSEENIRLSFKDMKAFEPEQVVHQIPQLKAMRKSGAEAPGVGQSVCLTV